MTCAIETTGISTSRSVGLVRYRSDCQRTRYCLLRRREHTGFGLACGMPRAGLGLHICGASGPQEYPVEGGVVARSPGSSSGLRAAVLVPHRKQWREYGRGQVLPRLDNRFPGVPCRSRQKRDIRGNPVDRPLSLRDDVGLEKQHSKIDGHTIGYRLGGTDDAAGAAGFASLSRFNQSGGERPRSLYWPVGVPGAADFGGSPAGIRVVPPFRSTDAQVEVARVDRRFRAGSRRPSVGKD